MAKATFTIVHLNDPAEEVLIRRAVQKIFSPSNFSIRPNGVIPSLQYNKVEGVRGVMKNGKRYPRELPANFDRMEICVLCALESNIDATIALLVEVAPIDVGPGVASHLGFRALLADSQRGARSDWDYRDIKVFLSEVMMPYVVGSDGRTSPEQLERGMRTVLRCAMEGWKSWVDHQYNTLAVRLAHP